MKSFIARILGIQPEKTVQVSHAEMLLVVAALRITAGRLEKKVRRLRGMHPKHGLLAETIEQEANTARRLSARLSAAQGFRVVTGVAYKLDGFDCALPFTSTQKGAAL